MATHTYNFSGITNPSSSHKATYGSCHSIVPNFTPPVGTEFATSNANSDYGDIGSSDNVRAYHSQGQMGYCSYHLFAYVIPPGVDLSRIVQVDAVWEGYGQGGDSFEGYTHAADLYVRNVSAATWEKCGTSNPYSYDMTISFTLTASCSDYFDARTLYLCAYSPSPGYPPPPAQGFSWIYTDYTSLTLTEGQEVDICIF